MKNPRIWNYKGLHAGDSPNESYFIVGPLAGDERTIEVTPEMVVDYADFEAVDRENKALKRKLDQTVNKWTVSQSQSRKRYDLLETCFDVACRERAELKASLEGKHRITQQMQKVIDELRLKLNFGKVALEKTTEWHHESCKANHFRDYKCDCGRDLGKEALDLINNFGDESSNRKIEDIVEIGVSQDFAGRGWFEDLEKPTHKAKLIVYKNTQEPEGEQNESRT